MEKDQMEWFLSSLDCVAKNLADASADLVDMEPTDPNYRSQAQTVDILTKDYQILMKQYCEIINSEKDEKTAKKWYEKLDWTKIITTAATITACIGQSFAIYKWQRDGFLIGRDAAKIQMPRPV